MILNTPKEGNPILLLTKRSFHVLEALFYPANLSFETLKSPCRRAFA
jgi:hypothetical protein